MNKEIGALRDKARRSLNVAEKLHQDGDYDFSVSRSYYAIFYVVEALLLMKGKSYSKHSAVISGFYHEYVEKGPLQNECHRILKKAYDLRQEGDYWSSTSISEEVSHGLIQECGLFFKETEKLFDSL